MILDMIVWGFFSAWGWIGANFIADKAVPSKPVQCVVVESDKEAKACEIRDK